MPDDRHLPDDSGHDRLIRQSKRYDGPFWQEGRPYLECPHCGQYEFCFVREPEYTSTSIIPFVGERIDISDEYYECENCEYRTEAESA